MDNQNNNQINNQSSEENSSFEPIVLGELKHEKIGKPTLVIEMLVIFIVVLIGFPILKKLSEDENSFVYKLIEKIQGNETTEVVENNTNNKDEFLDGNTIQLLEYNAKIRFENLILENFKINQDSITLTMYSYTGIIDLSNDSIYLNIYSTNDELLSSIKLEGRLDFSETTKNISSLNLNLNASYDYKGKIVRMTDTDYPDYNVNYNEEGIQKLTCVLDNRTIEYIFNDNMLVSINDNVNVPLLISTDNNDYALELKNYTALVNNIGNVYANIIEDENGFTYNANIPLSEDINISEYDSSYYNYNTKSNLINYAQEGKGFDCK